MRQAQKTELAGQQPTGTRNHPMLSLLHIVRADSAVQATRPMSLGCFVAPTWSENRNLGLHQRKYIRPGAS